MAVKLANPGAAAQAAPLEVLSFIVLAGLSGIGVTLDMGNLEVALLPLGIVLVFGWTVSWAAHAVARRDVAGVTERALDGMKLALPLGVMCLAAALLFQTTRDGELIRAAPAEAFLLALLWGALFGAVGGLRSTGSLRWHARRAFPKLRVRKPWVYEGLRAAGVMLVITALLSALAVAVAIVWFLMTPPTGGLRLGDTASFLSCVLVFFPNALALIACFALGAPVELGPLVTSGIGSAGGFPDQSLLGWGGHSAGGWPLLLVLIPLVACLVGGFRAHRNSLEKRAGAVLVVAALVYASTLLLLGWVGSVRLGLGILGPGVGTLAPDPLAVFVLGLSWAVLAGGAGWGLAHIWTRRALIHGAAAGAHEGEP